MKELSNTVVNLAGEYPIYKKEGAKLVRLTASDPKRRYSLTTNVQTKETYYLQYSDEEEAAADRQKAEWDAGAPAREAEAKRQAEEAKKFEDALQYKRRIVAFLDILGWAEAILAKEENEGQATKILGKTLAQLKGIATHFNSLNQLMPKDMNWPGNPMIIQFSDSLVISADDDERGKEVLQNVLLVLTSNLIGFGFLVRGGVTRGELFHSDGLVFGPALIDAYKLESAVASNPRVILSKELSAEWNSKGPTGDQPWIPSPDGYLFFNFLSPFMGNPFFSDPKLWQSRLQPVRDLILRKAQDSTCPEAVFAKYIWLAGYFDKVCDEQPNCGVEKVLQTAMQTRWRSPRHA